MTSPEPELWVAGTSQPGCQIHPASEENGKNWGGGGRERGEEGGGRGGEGGGGEDVLELECSGTSDNGYS